MGQRVKNNAVTKDAQIKLSMEGCAAGMERRSNGAGAKDAQI